MKNRMQLLLIGMFLAIMSCTNKIDPSKLPDLVRASFAKQFPSVTAVWEKEDGKYEAVFELDKHEMSAVFEGNGALVESEIEIAVTDLPEAIRSYVTSHYNKPIKEASRITLTGEVVQYEAALKGKDLIFDANGIFLKEVSD